MDQIRFELFFRPVSMEMAKNKISNAQDLNVCQLDVITVIKQLFFFFGPAHKPKFGLFSRSLLFPIAVLFIGSFVAHFIFFFVMCLLF